MKQCRAIGGGNFIRVAEDGVVLSHTEKFKEAVEPCSNCGADLEIYGLVKEWKTTEGKTGWWLVDYKQCTNRKMKWDDLGKRVPVCGKSEIISKEFMSTDLQWADQQWRVGNNNMTIKMKPKTNPPVIRNKKEASCKYPPSVLVQLFNRCIESEDNENPESIAPVAEELGIAVSTANTYVYRERRSRQKKSRPYIRRNTEPNFLPPVPKPEEPTKQELTKPTVRPHHQEQPTNHKATSGPPGGCLSCHNFVDGTCRKSAPVVIMSIRLESGPITGHPSRWPIPPDLKGCADHKPRAKGEH